MSLKLGTDLSSSTGAGLGLRGLCVVFLFGGSPLLALAASGKAFNYHEARYAEGAREMLENGSWLVPTIGERARLQKPPLLYWSMAAAMAAFGAEREWPARLPSVVAALLVAAFVADLAARRFGRTFGLVAGLAQVSFVYVLVSGPLADPDMMLAAAVTGGMWCFARGLLDAEAATRRRFALGFWAAAGLGFLVKGPIGPALFVPAAAVYSLAARRRDAARFLLDRVGIGVFAVLVITWPLAAYLSHPGIVDAWREENVARFRGALGSSSPIYYLYTAPWMVLPWTPFAVVGAMSLWKERGGDPAWGLVLTWLAVGIAILSASAGKHDRYLAPVLPAVALLAARGLVDVAPRVRSRTQPATLFAAALAVEWMVAVGIQQLVAWRFDAYRAHRELAQRSNRELPSQSTLFVVGVPNNTRTQLLYYVRHPMRIVDEAARLEAWRARGPSEAWVLAPQSVLEPLGKIGTVEVVDRSQEPLAPEREAGRLTLLRLRAN